MTSFVHLPSGRAGQALALAILCLSIAVGYVAIVAPVLDLYRTREERLTDRRMLASRLTATAAELPGLRAEFDELQGTASNSKMTLDGASDAIAGANLQGQVDEVAAAAGLTIGSTETLPAENQDGYRRIGLRIAVSGEYEAIVRFLGDLDAATPPLVLANLQLHSFARLPNDNSSVRLEGRAEVYGFRSSGNSVAATEQPNADQSDPTANSSQENMPRAAPALVTARPAKLAPSPRPTGLVPIPRPPEVVTAVRPPL